MATERQLLANRMNARFSTGPKTAEGKANSRLNALKHGLTANHYLLTFESESDFDDFAAAFTERLMPVGVHEKFLVERIIGLAWRLLRVPKLETVLFNWLETKGNHERSAAMDIELLGFASPASSDSIADRIGRMVEALVSGTDLLGKLQRYEKSMSSELSKLFAEFKLVQASAGRRSRPKAENSDILDGQSIAMLRLSRARCFASLWQKLVVRRSHDIFDPPSH